MKRIISAVLALTMAFACCCGSSLATEASIARASLALTLYNSGLAHGDSQKELRVSYDVRAVGAASSIGVASIRIYTASRTCVAAITGTTSNGLIGSNAVMYKGTYDYTPSSAGTYYAVVTVFAKVGTEYDSRAITTSSVTVP